ncbi:MAG: N-acetylmuramoyl-L-alanine amidase [Clostridium sp.]
MNTFGVNDGHTITGPGSGAIGKVKESEETRKVGNEVRRLFKERGHNVINCTIDKASSNSNALELIVEQANRQDLDWFISIHFNAGGGRGVEVYTYKGRQYQDAIDACNNISKLGFSNRGVKEGTGLYVIRKTKAKSMLVEVCFVDTSDADHYLKVGYKEIARAIVNGILGEIKEDITEGNKEEYDMKNIVVYGNSVDKRGAEYLSDYLQCPCIDGNIPFDYSKIENVYCVGGEPKLPWTGYAKKVITGSDRYETLKAVLSFMNKI